MMGFGGLSILLIIAVVYLLIKFVPNLNYKSSENKETALEILSKRFAKGDISKEEFEEKKKTLI